MKEFFCILLMVGLVQSTCVKTTNQIRAEGTGMTHPQVNREINGDLAGNCLGNAFGRKKRDSGYGLQYQPTPVKVVVMPPPGQAPADAPQPGQPGGGARPETNPYIAAMAPEGTVPVAVYPPFNNYNMKYPTECVLFSELEDFEDAYINDNGNVQLTSGQYEPIYSAPGTGSYSYQVATNLTRSKRQINFGAFFRPRSSRKAQDSSSSLVSSTPSFGQPAYSQPSYTQPSYTQPSYIQPPSYSPPSYVPPTEPPVKVVYRKFGYVCLITVSTDYCVIDDEPGYQQTGQSGTSGKPRQYGQAEDEEKKCPNNYGYGGFNNVDTSQKRYKLSACSKPQTISVATPSQPGQPCGPSAFA